jgi:hypothetical protein
MVTYSVGNSKFGSFQAARTVARMRNAADRKEPVEIRKNGDAGFDLIEIWVGEVTFIVAGSGMLAYSKADLDSIGAVETAGGEFKAASRGTRVGVFETLFDAAEALHAFAQSPEYRAG